MSTKRPHTPKQNCNFTQVRVTFQWTLFAKKQMHNVGGPVKCHTQSTVTASLKYAYHPTGHRALQDKNKNIMHGVHQMVTLTQTKPIAAVLFKHAWHSSGHHTHHWTINA